MSAPLLTPEQIADMRVSALMSPDAAHTEWVDLLARAVESATRAPLLAEIERLTAERDAAMADAERLCARLAEPDERVQPLTLPVCHLAVIGHRWVPEEQVHVPQLLIEFQPVPANSPNTAQGWLDRDSLAEILAATPEAHGITGDSHE